MVNDSADERAVMVCPQCEGEGGYPDGLDEAACHTDCTRCGGNGWIVDMSALRHPVPADVAGVVSALKQTQGALCQSICPHNAEQNWPHDPVCQNISAAIALLTTLASGRDEARGEPVAWIIENMARGEKMLSEKPLPRGADELGWSETPLYALPTPPQGDQQ